MTEPATARSSPLDRALGVTCLAVVAFAALLIATFDYGRDQGIYALVARSVLRGDMPYRDAWDFKPPGIFLVYAFARWVFGPSQQGIRLLESLGLAATAVGLVIFAKDHWQKPLVGLLAAALAAWLHVQLDFWHTGQPETFAGMVTIAAIVLGARSWVRPMSPRARAAAEVGAGVLFGFAGLLKPPLAGGGAVLAACLAYRELTEVGPSRLRRAALPVLRVGVGGAAPLVLVALWFAARGALGDLREVLFVFTPHYTALGWEGQTAAGLLHWGVAEWLIRYSSITTVGAALLLGFHPTKAERLGVALLLGIIFVQIVGVTMQAKFFPYHYGAIWPATALVAGLGLHGAWQRLSRRGVLAALVFPVGIALLATTQTATKNLDPFWDRAARRLDLLFGSAPADAAAWDDLATVADVDAGDNRAVADFLRARTPPERPVFVWGFEPVIYDLAERESATRFVYNVPQRVAWAAEPLRRTLMEDLTARPPSAIVVERRDVFPMVTGSVLDSADTLPSFPELRALLETRYALAGTFGDIDVYLER